MDGASHSVLSVTGRLHRTRCCRAVRYKIRAGLWSRREHRSLGVAFPAPPAQPSAQFSSVPGALLLAQRGRACAGWSPLPFLPGGLLPS